MATVSMQKHRVRGVNVVLFVGSSNNTSTSTNEDGRRGPHTEETRGRKLIESILRFVFGRRIHAVIFNFSSYVGHDYIADGECL